MRRTSKEMRFDSRMRQNILTLLRSVQTGSGAHTASYSTDIGGHFLISHPVSCRGAITELCGGQISRASSPRAIDFAQWRLIFVRPQYDAIIIKQSYLTGTCFGSFLRRHLQAELGRRPLRRNEPKHVAVRYDVKYFFHSNWLIESCVRLYVLYIYILLFTEHNGDVSPENLNIFASCNSSGANSFEAAPKIPVKSLHLWPHIAHWMQYWHNLEIAHLD
jgi:hypothetical protein